MMKTKILTLFTACICLFMGSCMDDERFTTSSSAFLSFSSDSISLDTIFSNVPSSTRDFWIHNNNSEGIRINSVRLAKGRASVFRVNIDGIDLTRIGSSNDVEIPGKDSIRVFVEATPGTQNELAPNEISDDLLLTLESGQEQKVNLKIWAWDALTLRNYHVKAQETFTSDKPIVIYDGLTVDSNAVLSLLPGTTLYFNANAGLHVYGTLRSVGTQEANVVMRGSRLDRLFDYLPYDRTPGQWNGVRIYPSSTDNMLQYTDIHSTYNGIVIDSCDATPFKLGINASTVHNCQGYGIKSTNAKVVIFNSQITNTLKDCIFADGGNIMINGCTIAQFYPFDSNRGGALSFTNNLSLTQFQVLNSIITGYADNTLWGVKDTTQGKEWNILFDHCILRTPKPQTEDSIYYTNIIYEDIKDTTHYAEKLFKNIDTKNLKYDFQPDSSSVAIGAADPGTVLPTDRLGILRDDKPDIGAYEFVKPKE